MAEQIILRKGRIIDRTEEILTDNIARSQSQIINRLISLLNQFDTQGGNFVNSPNNQRLILQLSEIIREEIYQTRYAGEVMQYLRGFNDLNTVNTAIQASVNNLNVNLNLTNVQRHAVNATLDALLGQGMNNGLIAPVSNQLALSVYSGGSVRNFEQYLRGFIAKNPTMIGRVNVTQIARDALRQYDGTIQSIIINQYSLDGLSYNGTLIKDSRPQCVRWVTMGRIVLKDLPSEIEWAYANGQGMIPDTTPENFPSLCGGYNCRHDATAVRLD